MSDSNNKKVRYDLENRRVALPATMIAILMLITIGNETIRSRQDDSESQKRTIAATQKMMGEDATWETQLAMNLSQRDERDVASLGREPSAFDQLRYGTLEGKYAVHLVDGKITEISFIENSSDRPLYIKPKDFLLAQKESLGLNFATVESKGKSLEKNMNVEKFGLKDLEGRTPASVDFITDEFGRFRELKVITH